MTIVFVLLTIIIVILHYTLVILICQERIKKGGVSPSDETLPLGRKLSVKSDLFCGIALCEIPLYHFNSPSPPISFVISSIRSKGNGGEETGFMARDISFIGLSSAAMRFELNAPQILQR